MAFTLPDINASIGSGVRDIASRLGVDTSLADKFLITDSKSNAILTFMNIMSVEVDQNKTLAQHPIETNTYLQDHVIFEPKQVSVTFLVKSSDYSDFYETLRQTFRDTENLYTVIQDNTPHENLTFMSMPIRRDPSAFDTVDITIVFHEFLFMAAELSNFKAPGNLSLSQYVDRQKAGFRQPQNITGQEATRLNNGRTAVPHRMGN